MAPLQQGERLLRQDRLMARVQVQVPVPVQGQTLGSCFQ